MAHSPAFGSLLGDMTFWLGMDLIHWIAHYTQRGQASKVDICTVTR